MKIYLNFLVGESAAGSVPILATADPEIVGAAVGALMRRVRDAGGLDDQHDMAASTIHAHGLHLVQRDPDTR